MPNLRDLVIQAPPPLDAAWLQWEKGSELLPAYPSMLERQKGYAESRRNLHARLLAPDGPFSEFGDISALALTVPSTVDGYAIPVIQYSKAGDASPIDVAFIYYHGGGLFVGEADSEELSCRRIVKQIANSTVYSVGYRLTPQNPATTSLADSTDAFDAIRKLVPAGAKVVLVGSSSGGELAAFMQQHAGPGAVAGTILRGPVTCSVGNGPEYVPERFRSAHTSAVDAFSSSLGGIFIMNPPRAGLERMPLEVEKEKLAGLGRTWIQVCSNDTLYSDGVCYALALEEAGVEVEVAVVQGYPHTFWLKAPELERAVRAEEEMIEGVKWVLGA